MDFIKKLGKWMDKIDEWDLEKKRMRREDRLGEVNYQALQNNDKEEHHKKPEAEQGEKKLVVYKKV